MLISYERISTNEQGHDSTGSALKEASSERIIREKATGVGGTRPELRSLLDYLRTEDVLVV